MSVILNKWKKIVKKTTAFQADILFSVVFFLFIIPIGFLTRNSLEKRIRIKLDKKRNSYWIKKEEYIQDITWARKQ